ncbi:MAG: SPOR domain-containing protein [Gammaproteobacteria bacterium]|nr:MAG: SPOR domain-containing protein [Gammaproteobacteria bacterium]
MAKDYAKKYTKYNYLTPKRKNNRYLWLMLGISVGLLALGLFLLKSTHKDRVIPSVEKIVNKKKLEMLEPQSPEPKFDFYNILPQNNLNLSPHVNSPIKEIALPNDVTTSIQTTPGRPINAMLSLTPEQVAIAEAKKQLEEEMGQFNNEAYILLLGNFYDQAHAEQLQAQALLKGFPVQKKDSIINGKLIYQIFIGPADLNKLSQDKKRLNEAGLAAVLVKVTP